MIETINNFVGYNLSAILFALAVLIVFGISAKLLSSPFERFILVPIFDYILIPLSKFFTFCFDFWVKAFSFKGNKEKDTSSDKKQKPSFFDEIISFFEKLFNFEKFIKLASNWFEKFWLLKLIFLVIFPLFFLNYYFTAVMFNSSFFDFNSSVLIDAIGSFAGAVIVSVLVSLIFYSLGTAIKKTISLSHLVFCSLGMVHFFI